MAKGAHVVYGGSKWDSRLKGVSFEPTILSHVRDDMLVMKEEHSAARDSIAVI